jgi:hypothetical protein
MALDGEFEQRREPFAAATLDPLVFTSHRGEANRLQNLQRSQADHLNSQPICVGGRRIQIGRALTPDPIAMGRRVPESRDPTPRRFLGRKGLPMSETLTLLIVAGLGRLETPGSARRVVLVGAVVGRT